MYRSSMTGASSGFPTRLSTSAPPAMSMYFGIRKIPLSHKRVEDPRIIRRTGQEPLPGFARMVAGHRGCERNAGDRLIQKGSNDREKLLLIVAEHHMPCVMNHSKLRLR